MVKRFALAAGFAACLLTVAPAAFAQGVSPEALKCRISKSKCACKKVCARFKAITANEKKPDAAKLAASNAKLEAGYTRCMSKADDKGGCSTGASTATLEAKVDSFVASYLSEVGSPSGAFVQ